MCVCPNLVEICNIVFLLFVQVVKCSFLEKNLKKEKNKNVGLHAIKLH